MQILVFSVFDGAVQAFLPPFYSRAKGEALRSFTDAANRKDENFFKYASDYALYYLGTWDDNDGSFTCPAHGPERMVFAHEVVVDDVFNEENRLVDDAALDRLKAKSRKLPM